MVSGYFGVMGQVVDEKNVVLIIGVLVCECFVDGKSCYFNGIIVVGEGVGIYFKQKLVLFGEYVLLQDLLCGLIVFFDLLMFDFVCGLVDQLLFKVKGYQIVLYICYEVVYLEFVVVFVVQSQVLLIVSNDIWFGIFIGFLQYLQMVQMCVLESGCWMICVINNGVIGLIDFYGWIVWQILQFQQGILCGEVIFMQGLMFYL